MARSPDKPRIVFWQGSYYCFYFDYEKQKRVRKACSRFDPPARTAEERKELLRKLAIEEKEVVLDQLKGGSVRSAFHASLIEKIGEYKDEIRARAKVRAENPNARAGISANTAVLNCYTIDLFGDWLQREYPRLKTGELDSRHLRKFFDTLAVEKVKRGKSARILRGAATLNRHRRILGACIRWLDELRPELFPDAAAFRGALKAQFAEAPEPVAFSPTQLQAFWRAAANPVRVVEVKRIRRGKVEVFQQSISEKSSKPHTPPDRLFLLLALTGCRLGEALAMKWQDIDLERGRITIRAQKTGKRRFVPLIGDCAGDVAPEFVKLLKEWKLQAGGRDYLLPHRAPTDDDPDPKPTYWRANWERIATAAGIDGLTPQTLRQNFTSYAAAFGIPAATCALWQGHRESIAERHYRGQALDALRAESIEAAMGLSGAVQTVRSTKEMQSA